MQENRRCLIIAEAGVNHNGDISIAKELCQAAKESGADVIKFQTWITERIITKSVRQATYQSENTGVTESQFDMLKRIELSFDAFREIKEYCDKIGITFSSTADESESLDFLMKIGIPWIKIGSGEITNTPYLRYVGKQGKPIILSTGMSTLDDVRYALDKLREGGAKDISLLHCTTSYPCPYDQVNLRAMETLHDAFFLPVGYSDHTIGIEIPVSAVALGATIIEKHLTLDRQMEGPDHMASTEPEEFKHMVDAIRNIEAAMGDGKKQPSEVEADNSLVVSKRIVASCPIKKGQIITEDIVETKRHHSGAKATQWDQIIGTVAGRDYETDEGIYGEDK